MTHDEAELRIELQVKATIHDAMALARDARDGQVRTDHLLAALASENDALWKFVLPQQGLSLQDFRTKIALPLRESGREFGPESGGPSSDEVMAAFDAMTTEAMRAGVRKADTATLLPGLLQESTHNHAKSIISHIGLNLDLLRGSLRSRLRLTS